MPSFPFEYLWKRKRNMGIFKMTMAIKILGHGCPSACLTGHRTSQLYKPIPTPHFLLFLRTINNYKTQPWRLELWRSNWQTPKDFEAQIFWVLLCLHFHTLFFAQIVPTLSFDTWGFFTFFLFFHFLGFILLSLVYM